MVRSLAIFVLCLSGLCAAPAVRAGAGAPLGKDVRFDGPAVLLFVPADAGCRTAVPELPGFAVAVIGKCEGAARTVPDPDGRIAKAFGAGKNTRTAVLVDEDRFVRRIITGVEPASFAAMVASDVKAWGDGRAIYDSQCARCHGKDGLDTSYQGVKPLGGLGLRTNEAGILEETEKTGVVDLSGFTPAQRRALAVYVAGL